MKADERSDIFDNSLFSLPGALACEDAKITIWAEKPLGIGGKWAFH